MTTVTIVIDSDGSNVCRWTNSDIEDREAFRIAVIKLQQLIRDTECVVDGDGGVMPI